MHICTQFLPDLQLVFQLLTIDVRKEEGDSGSCVSYKWSWFGVRVFLVMPAIHGAQCFVA